VGFEPARDLREIGAVGDHLLKQERLAARGNDDESVLVHPQEDRCERKGHPFVAIDERVFIARLCSKAAVCCQSVS
jgi:hypothetical protein